MDLLIKIFKKGIKMKYLKYIVYVIRHQFWVFYACYKKGIPLIGLVHDRSKWRLDEFVPYANHFYNRKVRDKTGYYKATDTGDKAFDFAWLLHQKRNKHHWQWWCLPDESGEMIVLHMSEIYMLEALCDWWGASKAQGFEGKIKTWYEMHGHKMIFHPDSRKWIEEHISDEFI